MRNVQRAACHCGAVQFEVVLAAPPGADGIATALRDMQRCNCSLCRRKGAIMAYVALAELTVMRGQDNLALYQWNTYTAKHYFCKTCGVYTHHQRRSNPQQYGFNVACLHQVDITALGDIAWGDGAALSVVDSAAQ